MRWMNHFLRFFFKHLYTTIAWLYDLVAYVTSVGQWRSWQMVGLEGIAPGRVLEIGYGTGHILPMLVQGGFDAFGIDPSKQMVRIATRRLMKGSFSAKLTQAKAQALPFCDETFHSILSTFPSEFIFDEATFKEAHRVLKPEGVFVIIPGVSEILGLRGDKISVLAVLDQLASILYQITGEAIDPDLIPNQDLSNRLKYLGFSGKLELVKQKRAVVMRISAKKVG
jgi:ubiquinone/menaquinone biosynthesis C-methylase UbiE